MAAASKWGHPEQKFFASFFFKKEAIAFFAYKNRRLFGRTVSQSSLLLRSGRFSGPRLNQDGQSRNARRSAT
jgi:hypothetical protein